MNLHIFIPGTCTYNSKLNLNKWKKGNDFFSTFHEIGSELEGNKELKRLKNISLSTPASLILCQSVLLGRSIAQI